MFWHFPVNAFAVAAGLETSGKQSSLGGVSYCFPDTVLFHEVGVVAAEENGREFAQGCLVFRLHLFSVESNLTL